MYSTIVVLIPKRVGNVCRTTASLTGHGVRKVHTNIVANCFHNLMPDTANFIIGFNSCYV